MCKVQRFTYACGCVHSESTTDCGNVHLFGESGHRKVAKKDKVMTMDCRKCRLAKKAKEKEEIAAVHTAVDKQKSHLLPIKKVCWEESSK
jgi:hypothetical protein